MARKSKSSIETENGIFPVKLRELMEREPKTTQPQLAAALGIQRQTVSNYANGQSSPDWETLARIADFFGVSVDWLLGRTGTESPNADVQAVCHFTGLSENAVELLRLTKTVSRVINTLSEHDEGKPLDAPLYQFAAAYLKIEMEAVKAAAFAISEDREKRYIDASMKKEALELSVFRFSEVCRKLPDKYMSNQIISLIDGIARELEEKEFMKFLAEKQNGGNDNGKH